MSKDLINIIGKDNLDKCKNIYNKVCWLICLDLFLVFMIFIGLIFNDFNKGIVYYVGFGLIGVSLVYMFMLRPNYNKIYEDQVLIPMLESLFSDIKIGVFSFSKEEYLDSGLAYHNLDKGIPILTMKHYYNNKFTIAVKNDDLDITINEVLVSVMQYGDSTDDGVREKSIIVCYDISKLGERLKLNNDYIKNTITEINQSIKFNRPDNIKFNLTDNILYIKINIWREYKSTFNISMTENIYKNLRVKHHYELFNFIKLISDDLLKLK